MKEDLFMSTVLFHEERCVNGYKMSAKVTAADVMKRVKGSVLASLLRMLVLT